MSEMSRYILAKKIARGGMAEIFLGKQVGEDGFQRLVAIKRILPHYSQDQEFMQMFRDEAHICKRLQHGNIVRVEDFEQVDGSYAIIMEFVDGADVRTLLHAVEQSRQKLPVPMACFIIAECARGLHYAHTKTDEISQQPLGIVHRDISPQNILVSFEGEIKVTDFGIADAESKLTDTRPGVVKGKYSYMSPEQISAKPVDQRTDIFALSIVFWEMLAMRRLFQGENEVDTITKVKNCRIDFELRQLNPEVDEELDAIIKKGLARDPKKRYRTAADLEKELRRYMSRRHPEFTPEDLGNFLKKVMENRRTESAAEIKRTLTETNLRPGRKTNTSSTTPLAPSTDGNNSDQGRPRDIEFDGKSSPGFAIRSQLPQPLSGAGKSLLPNSLKVSPGLVRPHAGAAAPARAGAPRQVNNPVHGGSPLFRRPRRQSFAAPLVAILFAAALFFVGARAYTSLTAQYRLATVQIRTQPRFVRLTVGDTPIEGSHYVDTTANKFYELHLPPGPHTLLISRAGFAPVRHKFTVKGGERQIKDDIVLRPEGAVAAVKIFVKGMNKNAVVSINSGYFRSNFKANQREPILAKDLRLGPNYEVKVTPSSDHEREFKCSFNPRSTSWLTPDELTIDMKDRKCSIQR